MGEADGTSYEGRNLSHHVTTFGRGGQSYEEICTVGGSSDTGAHPRADGWMDRVGARAAEARAHARGHRAAGRRDGNLRIVRETRGGRETCPDQRQHAEQDIG